MTQSDIADRLDELEAQLDDQQETIEHQQERIDQQAETIEQQQARLEEQDAIIRDQRERLDEEGTSASEADPAEQEPPEPETADKNSDGRGPIATRRGVLTAGSVLGLLGLGAGTASADASGQIGTSSDPLKQLYTTELNTGSNGLTVNTGGDRVLDLGTVTQATINGTDVDGGGNVVAGHPLNSVTNAVGAVISGGGSEITGGGTNFSHTVSGDFGTIGGGMVNDVSKLAATVGGGTSNTASGKQATVGGGTSNTASGDQAFGGGGSSNEASAKQATVGGGNGNEASAKQATVGGGDGNTASGKQATVGGGKSNTASGYRATVPGGNLNTADGDYSFAAGNTAEANGNNGAFVWGDSSSTSVTAGAADEVRFQATGGFVIAPRLDKTTMLDVQDKDGNSLLAADTSNHKVQVFDGTESDSVEVSHDGTDGSISTSTGDLQLSPSGNVDVQSGTVENTTGGLTVTTNDNGDLTLNPGSGSSNDVFLKNLEINDDSILTVNSSGKVGIGSKAISDIGGGGSSSTLETGSTTGLEVTKPMTVPNVVGGNVANHTIKNSPNGATILGGADGSPNTIDGDYATVAGGKSNEATAEAATVTGGQNNKCKSKDSVVVSGWMNETGTSGDQHTVCGGKYNWVNGWRGIVAGGQGNEATGKEAFAAGNAAVADNNQAFVWNDGTIGSATHPKNNSNSGDSNFPDTALKSSAEPAKSGVSGSQTFTVGASGGVRFITGSSSVTYINSSGKFVSSGGVDAQGGTIENTTGGLTLDASGSVSVPTAPSSDDDVLRYQERVERASVTVGGVDNSGNDDSWGQSTTATKTWPNPFSVSNVVIVATIDEDESDVPANEVTVSVKNITSSDFDIVVHQMAAVDRSGVDYAVNVMIRKGPANI